MTSAWTWLVYASTESSDSEFMRNRDVTGFANQSLDRMMRAERGERVRVLVQQDSRQGTQRWEVGRPDGEAQRLGQLDAGDPATLGNFLRWGMAAAPAERYALVLWSHGSGWQPDYTTRSSAEGPPADRSAADPTPTYFSSTRARIVSSDDRAIVGDNGSGHAVDTLELGGLLGGLAAELGRPIDVLVMNACQMASVEVAYQLRGSVQLYVATEVNMPAQSLPYDRILSDLGQAPEIDAAALGAQIVRHYCDFMREIDFPWNDARLPGACLTALCPGAMSDLAHAVVALAAALRADLRSQRKVLSAAVHGAPRFSPFRLGDIGYFCTLLLGQPQLSPAIADAARAVAAAAQAPALRVARQTTSPILDEHVGLTTFLPLPNADGTAMVSDFYTQTDYSRDTGWGELLSEWLALM